MTAPAGAGPPGRPRRPSGRASSGLEEMCGDQVVGGEQDRRATRPRSTVSEGLWPGRWSTRSVRSRKLELARRRRAAAVTSTAEPHARKPRRDRPQRRDDFGGDAVAQHQSPPRSRRRARRSRAVVAQVGRERLQRRDLGARAAGEDRGQAEVVHVLVGDARAARCPRSRGRARRAPARARPAPWPSWARVDQRQRRVLDQVGVDAADQERRRDRQAMDAGAAARRAARSGSSSARRLALGARSRADQREHLVAAALHVLRGDERLQAQAQQRLGVGGRTLKCQSS